MKFRLAENKDLPLIKTWWKDTPHVREFWDNSPECWQNCEDYLCGKKKDFDYWLALIDDEPFALIMTSFTNDYMHASIARGHREGWFQYIDPHGIAVGLDFMIGNEAFLGKGLSYQTLDSFVSFFLRRHPEVTEFWLDPDEKNLKAVAAYSKAHFKEMGKYSYKDHTAIMMKRVVGG